MKDALDALAQSHVSTSVFGVAIRKAAISPADPVDYAFEELTIRFDEFLKRLYKSGNKQRGLFIFDKSAREIAIQRLATNFKQVGHNSGKTRNMAEVPVFVDSRASRLVQLADLVAYAIFRNYERQDSQFFDVFKHRFDEVGGIVHGLHHKT
jgi:hypothetical protein